MMMHWGAGVIVSFVTVFYLASCNSSGGGSSKVVSNQAKLTSTTLSARAACTNSASRCTPINATGDICFAILGLGELGGSFFSATWLAPESTFPNGPTSGGCSATTFNLASPATFAGKVSVPETEADMPSKKQVIRVELNYNYVDTTFLLSGGSIDGTYTVRTVYTTTATEDDTTGNMSKGDKLVKLPGETAFKWCNSSSCSTDRATVATGIYQDSTVTEAVFPGDGNSDYVPVTANFPSPLTITYAEITDATKLWTLDFQVSDAIVWRTKTPAQFTSVQEMVDNFRLKFGPNQSSTEGEEDDGIRASLTIGAAS